MRLTHLCVCCLFLASCASESRVGMPGQIDVSVKNAQPSAIDPEIVRSSAALHAYLVGELAYGKEEFGSALKSFNRSSELISEPEPIVYAKLAELYLRDGNLERALAESQKAIEARPDDAQTMMLQAGILEALQRDNEAEPIYLRMIESTPDMVEPYIYLSGLYLRQHQAEKSIAILRRLEVRSPKTPLAFSYLGRAYEEREEISIAERYYAKAHEAEPDRTGYGVDLVRVLLKQKKVGPAKEICRQILEKDPNQIAARKILGQLLLGENQYDEALTHLQVLEGVEQDSTDTRFKIALIQIEKQNLPEAIRELSVILALRPGHAEARYYLASAYAGSGQKKEAMVELYKITPDQKIFIKSRTLAAFILRQEGNLAGSEKAVREALAKDPSDRQLLDYLVLILRDSGKFVDAERLLKRALDLSPQDEHLLFSYAVVLNDLQRTAEAEAAMERILEINPKSADALNFLAYSLADRAQETDKALRYVQQALAIDPDNAYYLDTLGWIYYQGGNYATAVDTLARATAAVSDDVVLLEHYGDALVKIGEIKKALEVYRRALAKEVRKNDHEQAEARTSVGRKLEKLLQQYSDDSSIVGKGVE